MPGNLKDDIILLSLVLVNMLTVQTSSPRPFNSAMSLLGLNCWYGAGHIGYLLCPIANVY